MLRGIRGLSGPLLLLLTLSAGAAQTGLEDERLRFSGFGTLGVTRGGDEVLGFRRDMYREGVFAGHASVWADSLLGVQVDARATDHLGATLQLVGKDRADDSLEDAVEWAFLRYHFNPDWTLRAGRIGFDVFLLSEYRSLGFSYLWTRPPIEFYAPVAFDSFDGADLAWTRPLGEGTFRLKLYAGQTANNFFVEEQLLEVELNPIYGVSLSWESERWQWRISAASNQFDESQENFPGTEPLAAVLNSVAGLWPEAQRYVGRMALDEPHVDYYNIGMVFTEAPWLIQSEIGYVDSEVGLFPTLYNGYLSLGYQIGAVTLFGLVSSVHEEGDRDLLLPAPVYPGMDLLNGQLALLQQATQRLFDSTHFNQTTWTTGLRWDLRYDLALKLQADHSRVEAYGGSLWDRQEPVGKDKALNTLSINLNFVF